MGKIIFFGGKGGVGKTSCSSAYAIARSNEGKKVLLISTDPAHSTSDLFNTKIGSKITRIKGNLFGLEIDPQEESDKYINSIKGNLTHILSPIILEEIKKQLDAARVSPGSHESALFDKMIELINNESENYDFIIFDTAPTGHTIRLLSLPELLGAWIDSLLIKRRKAITLKKMVDRNKDEDPIVKILTKRKDNMEKARKTMIDGENLEFIFVLNAERLPIEETKKAVDLLKKYKIPVKTLVINRILPETNDEFWKKKKEIEKGYLVNIERSFNVEKLYKIPMFNQDMHEDSIDSMAEFF